MSATKALCWSVVRTDGSIVLGTNHDTAVVVTASGFAGTYLATPVGVSATDSKLGNDLSVDNMEINGALLTMGVTAPDIEAGLYDGAAIVIFEVDWTNPSTVIVIQAGTTGKITRTYEGAFTVEVQGPQRQLTQLVVEAVSKTCRASLGDSRCKIVMTPLTFNGVVSGLIAQDQFNDSSLNQAGPVVEYLDTTGSTIPSSPYQITPIPPSGGTWVSDVGVTYADGTPFTSVGSDPAEGQYSVAAGVYTFNSADVGKLMMISYDYTYGFFNDGKLTWTSGTNTNYSMEVRMFTPAAGASPALVQLFQPMVNVIAIGDGYIIDAGCNRLLGTCRDRYDNLANMRAEPYTPGSDALARVLT